MDDFDGTPPPRRPTRNLPSRAAKIKAPARITRSSATYISSRTSPSSDNFDESDISPPAPRRSSRKRKTRQTAHPTVANKRRRLQGVAGASHPNRHFARANVPRTTPIDDTPLVFPPWQTLPYHVWLRILDYVAEPVRDVASRPQDFVDAISDLLAAARTCKVTVEPALANLYKCPPFYRKESFGQFVKTLSLPSTETIIRYRPKVEILRIEVGTFLARKSHGIQFTLKDVAQNLPRLSHLELYHDSDLPPFRRLDEHVRWRCAEDDLAQALAPFPGAGSDLGDKTNVTQLQSWRWNSRLFSEAFPLERLPEVHQTPSFVTLRKVAYVNYQPPSWGKPRKIRDSEEMQELDRREVVHLANAISALPNLEHLVLESSTLANGSLLGLLPRTLRHLELINCWEIVADDFTDFLLSHGNSLRKLTLKHCQSLSLAFLPVLGTSCPNLTHLDVDLSYFKHHEHYNDNKPEYDTLLENDQVPTWPSTLQSIEIVNMRKWTQEAAEMFFESLMDSARELPSLRHLVFKVMLSIGIRQRQELRQLLSDRMTRIFKRKSKAPKVFTTLRSSTKEPIVESLEGHKVFVTIPTRRSTRIADQLLVPTSPESDIAPLDHNGLDRAASAHKNIRTKIGRLALRGNDADDEDSEDELAAGPEDERPVVRKVVRIGRSPPSDDEFLHRLCDVVDIQVDNKRPTERQYGMDDFLDTPEESESEWDGGDDDILY